MKILIVSDTHKAHGNLERALELEGQIDMLIHLGDVEGKEDYVEALAGARSTSSAGTMTFSPTSPGRRSS